MKVVFQIGGLLVLCIFAYFSYQYIQTHMGQQALEKLEFPMHTLEEGLRIAERDKKLVLADYSAIWCPTCRRLDEEVFASEQVSDYIKEAFVYVRLEYDSKEGIEFADTHDLQGFPRIVVLKKDGSKVTEMPLMFDPVEYADNLQKVVLAQQTQVQF